KTTSVRCSKKAGPPPPRAASARTPRTIASRVRAPFPLVETLTGVTLLRLESASTGTYVFRGHQGVSTGSSEELLGRVGMAHRTILLIDYEPRSIERFRQPLTDAGYGVEVATDGVSGIEAFHRLSPDMVLVEAMIPKRHGFEVCQELKRTPHGKRTPVLITTGVYKGRKYRTQALHIYGCDEYIEKPIAPEQLLAVVGKFFPVP